MNKAPIPSTSRLLIRPTTREKFDRVSKVKRWKLVEVADAAIDALLATDPQLRPARSKQPSPA